MINLLVAGKIYPVEQFIFSGGEVQIRIPPDVDYIQNEITVQTQIKNSDAAMALLMTMNALRFRTNEHTKFILELKYFPYARQDRRCQSGEADAMSVFAQFINGMRFDEVVVWDLHNEDMLLWLINFKHVKQDKFVKPILTRENYDFIVSPDKGAVPKIERLGYPKEQVIVGEKVRDVSTGQITETRISYERDIVDSRVLIVDDICDGGRTFIELAKVLKAAGVATIDLYVTHGIFSNGLSVFDDIVDNIYTTNSFYDGDDFKVTIV